MNRPAGRLQRRVARHPHQPRPGPQRLHGDHAAVAEEADRRHAAEVRVAPDLARSCRGRRRLAAARPAQRGTCQAITRHGQRRSATASPQNSGRQPTSGISHCTGKVDATMPNEPVISIQELARSCAAGVEPAPEAGQRRHQAGADAHAAQHARRQQAGEAGGQRERHAAGHRTSRKPRITFFGPCGPARCPGAAAWPRSRGSSRPPAGPGRAR